MRDGWIKTPIGDVAQVLSGFAFKSELFNESEGMPLIRIRDLPKRNQTEALYSGSYEDRYVVRQGDFLIGMDGEFHCYEWTGEDALLNQRVCRIQDFKINLVEPRFIYFAVNQYLDKIEQDTGYTTVKHISSKQILAINIPLPPIPEQKRIVDLISSVDSYIESLQQQLESAKRSRNAVLHELLTAGGDDWVETTIGDISTFISIRKTPNQLSSNSIYVGLEHLEPNIKSINNFDSTSKVSSSLTPFDVGDVLFGRLRPYLHKVALAEMKGFCSPEILVLRANPNVLPQMLFLYCDADSTIKICVERSAGTRMPRTSTDDLASIEVQLPPMSQQEQLADLFGAFDANIVRLNLSLEKTQLLRSGILSDLLSGKHEIPASYDKVFGAA